MPERTLSEDALPIVVAHRGASATETENTLPAFEAAIAVGAGAVELDVRLTRDGHPVVIHDADVARITGGAGLVRDLSLDEIERLLVATSSGGTTRIPRITDVLVSLSARVAVVVEIKNLPGEPDHTPDAEPLVDATLRALDGSGFVGPVLIASFNPSSLGAVRAAASDVPTALLSIDQVPAELALEAAIAGGHSWILPSHRAISTAGERVVARGHAAGIRIGTWVVDDPARARELFAWGIDAVATNDPAAIVPVREGSRA
jgi:glycerophosphoryl diester phosphodiesterase